MSISPRKFLRKTACSILKQYYILTSNGYSVGSAYGARFLFDWRHSLDKKVALELYEYEQICYLFSALDALKPVMFLDIGAHAALYSIILKKRYPALEVHAFEPVRLNLSQLYGNLFLNRLHSGITVHEHGISSVSGTVSFEDSDAKSTRATGRISSSGASTIPVRRLDDIFDDRGRTVAIKIDVEGHEASVIEGAEQFLTGNRCFLQIEASPDALPALTQQLDRLGYRFITSYSDHYFSNIETIPASGQA